MGLEFTERVPLDKCRLHGVECGKRLAYALEGVEGGPYPAAFDHFSGDVLRFNRYAA